MLAQGTARRHPRGRIAASSPIVQLCSRASSIAGAAAVLSPWYIAQSGLKNGWAQAECAVTTNTNPLNRATTGIQSAWFAPEL